MVSELLPTDEELDLLVEAINYYRPRLGQLIATEEVLKATQRLSEKVEPKSRNEKAFDTAFAPKDNEKGEEAFLSDLVGEIDQKALKVRCKDEDDKLTLLQAKLIRLREECRRLGTDKAIVDLLK
jgi:hypothetical protein